MIKIIMALLLFLFLNMFSACNNNKDVLNNPEPKNNELQSENALKNDKNIDNRILELSFYSINPQDNTLGKEILRQENGEYLLPLKVGSFVNFEGKVPKTVVAYFTSSQTNFEEKVGFAEPPFLQVPLSVQLAFPKNEVSGELHFTFIYDDGTSEKSEKINVRIE